MQNLSNIGLPDVQAVYSGPEGQLWELIMGATDPRRRLPVVDGPGRTGRHRGRHVGSRSLLLQRGGHAIPGPLPQRCQMRGVDATPAMVELGRRRTEAEGFNKDKSDRITFTLADACETGLPAEERRFRLGRRCLVLRRGQGEADREAVRLTKPRGTIAFTDWIEGPPGLAAAEAERFSAIHEVRQRAKPARLCGTCSADARLPGRGGGGHGPLRHPMSICTWTCYTSNSPTDALRILNYDAAFLEAMDGEMKFLQQLAHDGKIIAGVDRSQEMLMSGSAAKKLVFSPTLTMETKTCCQCAATATESPGPADPLAWFEKMLDHCHQHAVAAKAAGKRVVGILCEFTPRELIMAAGGRAGLPLRRLGQDDPRRRRTSARQSLPADQIDLRLPSAEDEPFPGNGRSGGGRDDLRRQEEDVRADGPDAAGLRPRTAAEGRRPRCPGALACRAEEVPRLPGKPLRSRHHRRPAPRGNRIDEPRAGPAAATWRA